MKLAPIMSIQRFSDCRYIQREIFSESCWPNLNCKYHYLVDLAQQSEFRLVINLSFKRVITIQIWFGSTQFRKDFHAHREIFPISYKSTWNQIVLTSFRLIRHQTNVRLNPNQSETGKYNLISGWFNAIQKRFPCAIYSHKAFWHVESLSQTRGKQTLLLVSKR